MNMFKKHFATIACRAKSLETSGDAGFSIIELLIVVAVLAILSGIAYMSFSSPRKFAADDQALKILDIMQEARQKSLTQRRVMRVELNDTKKLIRLINEYDIKATNATTGKSLVKDSDDDKEIRSVPLDTRNLIVGNRPSNVTTVVPTQTSAIPEMSYQTTIYPPSNGDSVFTLCFVKDGRVLSPGANGLCEPDKDDPGGATIYVSEKPDGSGKSKVVRAVTVNSISGQSDEVKCQLNSAYLCTTWVK